MKHMNSDCESIGLVVQHAMLSLSFSEISAWTIDLGVMCHVCNDGNSSLGKGTINFEAWTKENPNVGHFVASLWLPVLHNSIKCCITLGFGTCSQKPRIKSSDVMVLGLFLPTISMS